MLLDVVMPGEDGLAFLKWLRSEGHQLPVLMVSALDTAKPAVEALQYGAADYLVKGFELEELRTRVGEPLKLLTPAGKQHAAAPPGHRRTVWAR